MRNIFFALIIFLPLFSFATETADTLQVYELQDTIVVVADRFTLPLKDITYTHQIIPQSLINTYSTHSALELVDITFPSAFTLNKKVIGYGVGSDGAGNINIRGQGGRPNTGVLVLINGHPDFMGLFGHPLPDVYGMDDVQQVEILAGPTSTVFGSQAMAGVINIKTKPDYNRFLRFSLEGGSYDTYNIGINLNKSFDKWGIFVSARHNKTNGHIDKSGFESTRLQAGVEYTLSPVWHLSAHGRYVPYEFDDPARGDSDPANLGTYGIIRRGTGELILENKTASLSGSTQMYGNWGHHRFFDGFEGWDYTYGLSSYQQWQSSKDFSLSAGADLIQFGGKAENDQAPPGIVDNEEKSLTSVGLYVLGFYSGISQFNFKFGMRYQYNSLPLNNFAPVAGLTYSALPQLKLYANFQTGFRYPTLNELYLFPPRNPDLKDEKINSAETGIWYYWGSRNSLRLTYFYNDVNNLIQQVAHPSPPPPVHYANSGNAQQHGVEGQLTYHLFSNLGIQVAYSYLDPNEITAFNPQHQFKYMLQYRFGIFNASAYGKYVEKLFTQNNRQDLLPDYHVLNMILSLRFSQWDIYVKFLNVLDRKYYVLSDYMAPRFHILSGIKFDIK
jgi:outer membrane cobalamin receptor